MTNGECSCSLIDGGCHKGSTPPYLLVLTNGDQVIDTQQCTPKCLGLNGLDSRHALLHSLGSAMAELIDGTGRAENFDGGHGRV
jgi:hypothetical protein